MLEIIEKASLTKLVIFDVDGVLTDGSLFIDNNGMEYKAFNSRDGLGMKMLQKSGVKIAIITGRSSEVVSHRMKSMGIVHVYQGQDDKLLAYENIKNELKLSAEEIAYVGDDIIDLPVMRKVGLAIAVQDAHPLVIKHAHWQTPHAGGRGAGRDVCELVMEAQNNLDQETNRYL